MNLTTKGDLVLAALRKLGVASNATLTDVEPQSMEDGVNDLEMMMAEWLGGDASQGINVGYIFADADVAPDPGDEPVYQITLSMPSFSTLPAALLRIMRWKRLQNL